MAKSNTLQLLPQEGASAEHRRTTACTLSGFAEQTADRDGVDVQSLQPLTRLELRTRNSRYEVWVMEPEQWTVLIQGGRFFPRPTPAILCGSGFGGALLRVAWVGVGLSCELTHTEGRIVTSPIEHVEILNDRSLPGPF